MKDNLPNDNFKSEKKKKNSKNETHSFDKTLNRY